MASTNGASSLFHAKATVIDEKILYAGSQNLELRKEGTVLEAAARIISRTHARQAKRYLEGFFQSSNRYVYGPSELVGIPLPLGFLERKGVLSRIYTSRAEKTFRFYLSFLKEARQSGSVHFERTLPDSLKDDRRRLVSAYHQSQNSSESPYGSMRNQDISSRFGAERNLESCRTLRHEEENA